MREGSIAGDREQRNRRGERGTEEESEYSSVIRRMSSWGGKPWEQEGVWGIEQVRRYRTLARTLK